MIHVITPYYIYFYIIVKVQQYLEEHLMRAFPHRTGLLNRPVTRTAKNLKRRMSVKGAIKKTRSIAVERKFYVFCILAL